VGSLRIRITSSPAISPAALVAYRCASLKFAGTVITARSTRCPRYRSAMVFIRRSTIAEISSGEYSCCCTNTFGLLSRPQITWYG
jgi:hypothetical protein